MACISLSSSSDDCSFISASDEDSLSVKCPQIAIGSSSLSRLAHNIICKDNFKYIFWIFQMQSFEIKMYFLPPVSRQMVSRKEVSLSSVRNLGFGSNKTNKKFTTYISFGKKQLQILLPNLPCLVSSASHADASSSGILEPDEESVFFI